jgi:lysine 2,3-aminomutase
MAVPHFVIDAPGGGGKIPILPGDYMVHMDAEGVLLKNYENKAFHYPQPRHGSARELPMVGAGPSLGSCSTGEHDDL